MVQGSDLHVPTQKPKRSVLSMACMVVWMVVMYHAWDLCSLAECPLSKVVASSRSHKISITARKTVTVIFLQIICPSLQQPVLWWLPVPEVASGHHFSQWLHPHHFWIFSVNYYASSSVVFMDEIFVSNVIELYLGTCVCVSQVLSSLLMVNVIHVGISILILASLCSSFEAF